MNVSYCEVNLSCLLYFFPALFMPLGGQGGRHAAIGHASAFFPSLQILLMRRQDNRIVQYLSLSLSTRKAASLLKEEGKGEEEDKKRKDSSLRSEPGQKPGLAHFLQRSHGMEGVYTLLQRGRGHRPRGSEGRGGERRPHRIALPSLTGPSFARLFPDCPSPSSGQEQR